MSGVLFVKPTVSPWSVVPVRRPGALLKISQQRRPGVSFATRGEERRAGAALLLERSEERCVALGAEQQGAQVMDHRFEAARRDPALGERRLGTAPDWRRSLQVRRVQEGRSHGDRAEP